MSTHKIRQLTLGLTACIGGILLANCGTESPNPVELPAASSGSVTSINAEQARIFAQNFVALMGSHANRAEWSDVEIDVPVPFVSNENIIQAYEFPIKTHDGKPQGWVMVEALSQFTPVSAFSTEGPSQVTYLQHLQSQAADSRKVTNTRFLWAGPRSAALEITYDDGGLTVLPSLPEMTGLSYEQSRRTGFNEFMQPSAKLLQNALSTGNYSALLDQNGQLPRVSIFNKSETSSLDIYSISVGRGAAEFSNFVQRKKTWRNSSAGGSTCYGGCTPTAFAIILEYWDRNGYPTMVSSNTDNSNTSYNATTGWDSDVDWMIDELRGNMRTWCDGDQGSTNFSNYERVQDHVNSRRTGKSWTASDTSFWWKWNWIQDEISAGRPVAIHYAEKRDGKINHSAAAYEYNPTTDYICAEKGWVWDPAKVTWDCFTRFEVGDYHVTKLQPF